MEWYCVAFKKTDAEKDVLMDKLTKRYDFDRENHGFSANRVWRDFLGRNPNYQEGDFTPGPIFANGAFTGCRESDPRPSKPSDPSNMF
jgi:hypothetical protein